MAFHFTLTVEEAARIYELGRSSTYRAVERGQLQSLSLGRRRLVLTVPLIRKLGLDEQKLLPILRRQPAFLTVARTAKLLRVSPDLVLDAISSGLIPAERLGHSYRIPTPKLLRLLGVSEDLIDDRRRKLT